MLAWTDRIALYLIAAFVVVFAVSGIAAALSGGARRLLVRKLGGSIYRAITEDSRAAETAKQQIAVDLHQALRDLGVGISTGYANNIEPAAARVRVLCPDTRQAVDTLLAAMRAADRSRDDLYVLLDAVRDSAADCLKV